MEEENKLVAFLKKHWSKLLLGLLAIATVAVWSERLLKSGEDKSRQDFVVAAQIFNSFQKGDVLPTESIESVENILNRHPELHPKYDAMLALTFFSQANAPQAKKYAQSLLGQIDRSLPPFYKEYARTTLLISEGNYSKALELTLALQENLKGNIGYQALDGMNTLRLLFLAERLGETSQKEITWQKLEHLPAYAAIQPLFHEGNISLKDYINHSNSP